MSTGYLSGLMNHQPKEPNIFLFVLQYIDILQKNIGVEWKLEKLYFLRNKFPENHLLSTLKEACSEKRWSS